MNLKTSSWPWAKMSNEKLKAPLAMKHKITIAAKQRERTRERETKRMRATLLAVTTSDLVGLWMERDRGEGVNALRSPNNWRACAIGASLSFSPSPTLYECYTKCIFQTILTHSINLRRSETRQGNDRRREERRAGQRTSTSTALIRAANLNAI